MDIDLIFKLVLIIVIIGISVKALKFLTSFIFKIALVALIILVVYKMFIGV
ncbi:hypothetical protein [Romboutsia sp.]|uniref:hypothetical protein n=1 Tax=Romboutsia sp. TaxID=1965302 RepID=UPI003F2E3438